MNILCTKAKTVGGAHVNNHMVGCGAVGCAMAAGDLAAAWTSILKCT